MMKNRWLAVGACLVVAALSGCGGGGNDGAVAGAGVDMAPLDEGPQAEALAAAGAACVPARNVRIQLFGDSTQFMQGDAVQRWMDERYGAGVVTATNHGVSGSTAADFPASAVEAGAITVVSYGINDARQPGATVEAFKARLRAIAPTVYQTQSPPIDAYAQAVRDVAKERGAPLIDVSAAVRAQGGWEKQVQDGVHPSEFLYIWINSQVVSPALAKLVDEKLCLASRDAAGAATDLPIRVSANSAQILWARPGVTAGGRITFVNGGKAPKTLRFARLDAPYAVAPSRCVVAARGGSCTVTVTMKADTLGAQGTRWLTVTDPDNVQLQVALWGFVAPP